jgi:two-component system response regulator
MPIRKVLLVAESEVEAELIREMLRSNTSRNAMLIARSTSEAERELFGDAAEEKEQECPDLVVIELADCLGKGFGLLARLKKDLRTRHIPVVTVGQGLLDKEIDAIYRTGANSYLDRPGDNQQFLSILSIVARYWLGLNLSPHESGWALVGTSSASCEPK